MIFENCHYFATYDLSSYIVIYDSWNLKTHVNVLLFVFLVYML